MLPTFLLNYTKPREPRWQASQRFIFHFVLLKNVFYIPFVIVSVVEVTLFRKWIGYYNKYRQPAYYSADSFWLRVSIAMFFEFILIIAQTWTIHRDSFHPVFALVSSLFAFMLWVMAAVLNGIVTYSDETWFDEKDAWLRLCYAETSLSTLIALVYAPIFVGGCIAVHRWRRIKRNGVVVKGGMENLEEE